MQSFPDSQPRSSGKRKWLWLLAALIGAIVLYQLLAVVIVVFVVQPVRIQGKGMSPTLNDGDKVFFWKQLGTLQRGDIVVHLYPLDTTMSYHKRIVGLPGEIIEFREGRVYINGSVLDEPYAQSQTFSFDGDEPKVIPANHYFVLGDNRANSSDSRVWGTVPRELIYGKYWWRYEEAPLTQ